MNQAQPQRKCTIYKPTVDMSLIRSDKMRRVLKDLQWYITGGQYLIIDWKGVFQHMLSCSTIQLVLFDNKYSQILKQIYHVKYNDLVNLFLDGNQITNIQPISNMHFPNLQYLSFKNNLITNIDCLHKLLLQNLKYISLQQNSIKTINKLSHSKFSKTNFEGLSLQNFQGQNSLAEDIAFVIKFEMLRFQYLTVSDEKIITQLKTKFMLQRKYAELDIAFQQ